MPLTTKQLRDVCLLHAGHKQCRYLAEDELKYGTFNCLRKTSQRTAIDQAVADAVKDMKSRGLSVSKSGVPTGDNCSGYPLLRHIDLGYDVKP